MDKEVVNDNVNVWWQSCIQFLLHIYLSGKGRTYVAIRIDGPNGWEDPRENITAINKFKCSGLD